MKRGKQGLIPRHPAPPQAYFCEIEASGLIPKRLKRSCIILVWESMEACISVSTCAKSSIRHLSHPITSVEFSPTNSPEDEGNFFVHSNPLGQFHIIYTSVTKHSLAKGLVLLHLLSATDGNVIVVCGRRNVIMCKIANRPPGHVR
jgi:hypothetical protein